MQGPLGDIGRHRSFKGSLHDIAGHGDYLNYFLCINRVVSTGNYNTIINILMLYGMSIQNIILPQNSR